MSFHSGFATAAAAHRGANPRTVFDDDDNDSEGVGSKGRALSYEEREMLGMWAATMKIMAGTQTRLPSSPRYISFGIPLAPGAVRTRRYPSSTHPSAPPGSPEPERVDRTRRSAPTSGILREASAACTELIRVAQALERRTNAERRISRKATRHRSPTVDPHPASASTAPSVADSRRCRAATVRASWPSRDEPRPSGTGPDTLVPESRPPRPLDQPASSAARVDPSISSANLIGTLSSSSATTHPPPCPISPALQRTFREACIGPDGNDTVTSYGHIEDTFARELARILPWNPSREAAVAESIWATRKPEHVRALASMPPHLRIYLHALFMMLRPMLVNDSSSRSPPQPRLVIPSGNEAVYNLFVHWYCQWDGLSPSSGPAAKSERFSPLTQGQIDGEEPLAGQGYVLLHTSAYG